MHKTIFYKRNAFSPMRKSNPQRTYEEYWWTYPGAEDPFAPDELPDPFAAYRTGGTIRKFFKMLKTAPEKWDDGKRKRNLINIMGADWTVDANEALEGENGAAFSGVTYTGKYVFQRDALCGGEEKGLTQRRSWERQLAELKNRIAGKTWKISSQEDRWFYREGRVEVTDNGKNVVGSVTVTADCDPWKYEKYSSMDEWEFDDLDFECGIIREKEDYTASLAASASKTIPVFPLEKAEPVYIRDRDGALVNKTVNLKWNGDTGSGENYTITTTWLQTAFVPTADHYELTITNTSGDAVVVEVYYRGAMR